MQYISTNTRTSTSTTTSACTTTDAKARTTTPLEHLALKMKTVTFTKRRQCHTSKLGKLTLTSFSVDFRVSVLFFDFLCPQKMKPYPIFFKLCNKHIR